MLVSEIIDLRRLVGRNVKSTKDFADVPKGSIGRVINHEENVVMKREEIQVSWELGLAQKSPIVDWFSRDDKFDETQFLELVN